MLIFFLLTFPRNKRYIFVKQTKKNLMYLLTKNISLQCIINIAERSKKSSISLPEILVVFLAFLSYDNSFSLVFFVSIYCSCVIFNMIIIILFYFQYNCVIFNV